MHLHDPGGGIFAHVRYHFARRGLTPGPVPAMATPLPPTDNAAHARVAREWLVAACERLRNRLLQTMPAPRANTPHLHLHPPTHTLPMDDLAARHGLTALDVEILTLAVAPHVDVDMRDAIARFNDNLLANLVDVRLCVACLATDPLARLAVRDRLAPEAPLRRARLVTLGPSRDSGLENLLGQELVPAPRVLHKLLGHADGLDPALAAVATLTRPTVPLDRVVLPPGTLTSLLQLVDAHATHADHGPVVDISGPAGTGKTLLVMALAHRLHRPLLTLDATRCVAMTDTELATHMGWAVDQAVDADAVLALEGVDAWTGAGAARVRVVHEALVAFPGLVVRTSRDPAGLAGDLAPRVVERVELQPPGPQERAAILRLHVPANVEVPDAALRQMAGQFTLTGADLSHAAALAVRHAIAAQPQAPVLTAEVLRHACHHQLRAHVSEYAVRRKPGLTLQDLVVPADTRADVAELLAAAQHRGRVLHDWGFEQTIATGKGLIALFSGDSGTGKTLCAAIVAETLDLPLFQISIPRVVSKWVGETERNIEQMFTTARATHGVLLFDEADALFSSRTKVESSVDRYSNMATNLLLQEIEHYDGIVLLTTNLEKNIDSAFARRIGFKIHFPLPDAADRARIWQTLVPPTCPVDADLDWGDVGLRFELSGGLIKNAVLRAAYQAAADNRPLAMVHVESAARQACKDAGKVFRAPQETQT